MLDLEPIKKREEKASHGRWDWDGANSFVIWCPEDESLNPPIAAVPNLADADFIAAARQDIPALIEEVEMLRTHIPSRALLEQMVRVFEQHGTGDMYVWAKMALKVARA